MTALFVGLVLILLGVLVPWPAEVAWLGTILLILGIVALAYGLFLLVSSRRRL